MEHKFMSNSVLSKHFTDDKIRETFSNIIPRNGDLKELNNNSFTGSFGDKGFKKTEVRFGQEQPDEVTPLY